MTQLQHPGSERILFRDMSMSANIAAADNHSVSFLRLITCLPGMSIFIQKIQGAVIVEAATESTWQSSNGTPVPAAELGTPTTEGPFFWDFGERGYKLAEGEHLEFRNSAAGTALAMAVQAYMKPTRDMVAKTAGATTGYDVL